MFRLIVNADDYGYSRGVNHGIVDAYRYGIVSSATMLTNMPGFEHGAELAKSNPGLGLGVHLNATLGTPQTVCPTLQDTEGRFRSVSAYREDLEIPIDPDELYREWRSQIDRFHEAGLKATHLDSHHHIHAHPSFLVVAQQLAIETGLPLRRPVFEGVDSTEALSGDTRLFSDCFFSDFHTTNVNEVFFSDLRERFLDAGLGEGETIEIMCHPAYLDSFLAENSSYARERIQELEVLVQVQLPNDLVLVSR